LPELTPADQSRLKELDAIIQANKLHIAPVKAERRRILMRGYQAAIRERGR
jgi:hypothetical protein